MFPDRWMRLTSQGTSALTGTGDTILRRINVGITAASSFLTIMNHPGASIVGGFTSTAQSQIVMKLDTSQNTAKVFDLGDLLIEGGLVAFVTGGNPDITITYK